MNAETIQARIEAYKAQRETLIKQANEQIAALGGAIAALEDLLAEEKEQAHVE